MINYDGLLGRNSAKSRYSVTIHVHQTNPVRARAIEHSEAKIAKQMKWSLESTFVTGKAAPAEEDLQHNPYCMKQLLIP